MQDAQETLNAILTNYREHAGCSTATLAAMVTTWAEELHFPALALETFTDNVKRTEEATEPGFGRYLLGQVQAIQEAQSNGAEPLSKAQPLVLPPVALPAAIGGGYACETCQGRGRIGGVLFRGGPCPACDGTGRAG